MQLLRLQIRIVVYILKICMQLCFRCGWCSLLARRRTRRGW